MDWAWFVGADFQLFLIAPFIIWAYIRYPERIGSIIGYAIIISLALAMILNEELENTFNLNLEMSFDVRKYIFRNPFLRLPVYFLGISMGVSFRNYKNRNGGSFFKAVETDTKIRRILILFGLALMTSITLIPQSLQNGGSWGGWFSSCYQAVSGFLFVLGMIFVVASAMVKKWEVLTSVLSSGLSRNISRITYSGFLISGIVIMVHTFRQTTAPGFEI
jgi:hypothetical protein